MTSALQPVALWPVKVLFVFPGLLFGSWAIRIPDIARAADISTTTIGFALLVLAAGTVLGMPAASAALAKYTTKQVAVAALMCTAASTLPVGAANSALVLFVAMFLLGIATGIYSVTINTTAAHVEEQLDRPVLTGCYATYSLAALAASFTAGIAVGAGISPLMHLLLVNVSMIPTLVCFRLIVNAPQPQAFQIPRPTSSRVWVAAAVAFAALFGEGVITDWSAYFLRAEILAAADMRQAWGYSAFAICMVVGRSLGAKLIAYRGERQLLAASIALSVVGGIAVAASPNLAIALTGYVCAGIGLANLYPMTISIAARDTAPAKRQEAIASVSSIGYLGLLVGPAVVGLCSSAITLRGALFLPALILAATAAGIGTLTGRRPRPD